jgi:hypothetical protein
MYRYDPEKPPPPDLWNELDEQARIEHVAQYHLKMGEELPNTILHASFHAVIENQVLLGDETPVAAALARLMEEGLTRHEAIHALGSVLAEYMYNLQRGNLTGDAKAQNDAYYENIRAMTAEKWRAMDDE